MVKKAVLLGISLALAVFLLPVPVWAFGVGMAPMELEIENALRGGVYERVVTVFNPSAADALYNLRAEGQAEAWLSFYDWDDKTAIQSLTVPGESNTHVLVQVAVPLDIPNDTYTATIYAETSPGDNSGDMGVSTIMRASSVLSIAVTDIEILSGSVSNINARDTEAGFPLVLEISFKNTGNVFAQPRIDYQINRENIEIAAFSYAETSVKPESQETIMVEWETAADQTGDYIAHVAVSLDEKALATREIPFKILPPGSLTKQGELISLAYEGQPLPDSMLKIQADFQNTGQGDVRANLITELYRDGNLIDATKSEETLVPVGQTGTLTSYLKLGEAGKYTIKGSVAYEGKQTGAKEISVDTAGAQTGLSFTSWLIIIGIVVVLAVVIITVRLRRRRQLS